MRYASILLLLCALMLCAAVPQTTGRLCIDGACQERACSGIVEPAEQPRTFTFFEQSIGYRLGIIRPHERAIRCASQSAVVLILSTQPAPDRLEVRVQRKQDKTIWRIPLIAPDVRKPITFHIGAGQYELTVDAQHFVRFAQTISIERHPQNLHIALVPLPRLTGRVVDRSSLRPLARALISTDSGCEAMTDDQGRFSVEAEPQKWPKMITVRSAGYGDRMLAVPPAKADARFDEIYLGDSASIVVDLQQSPGEVEEVELEKLRENGRAPGPTVKTVKVEKDGRRAASIRFDDVEPGRYEIIARGAKLWERLGKRLDVAERDVISVPMSVEPFTVTFRLQRQAARSRIILRNLDSFWEAAVPLADGQATIDLWQGGHLSATIDSAGMTPFIEKRILRDGIATEWAIDTPPYEVAGTVTDSRTGMPVPGAAVSLRIKAAEGYSLTVSTRASSDGTFRFAPVAPGLHTLMAAAKDYPRTETSYEFVETEQVHTVPLQLTRTPVIQLTVRDEHGIPLIGARVFDPRRSGDVVSITDGSGIAHVFLPEKESREIFVVPADGSFGFVNLTSGAPDASLQIGPGVSRIVLRAETDAHEPLIGVTVVIRFNGVTLPYEVMQALSGRGSRTSSDAEGRIVLEHMPVGHYQFWPIASPSDLRAMQNGRPPALGMQVNPGENLTVMTFAAQQ